MKLSYLAVLGLSPLFLLSCQKGELASQPIQSPVAAETSVQMTVASAIVRSGTFVAGELPTEGTARIVTENEKNFLELGQDFKTSKGPDLYVILHRSDNVIGSTKPPAYPIKEQDYVVLERLQKINGLQRYSIPSNINLADYQSAAIWCRKFNATFGAAKLGS